MSSPKAAAKPKASAAKKPAAGKSAAKKPALKKAVAVKEAAPAPRKVEPAVDAAANASALTLAKDIERAVMANNLDFVSPEAQQALMSALVKLYGANVENGNKYPIVSSHQPVTSTDVMLACAALLKASNLQVFELGMWQSWTGR